MSTEALLQAPHSGRLEASDLYTLEEYSRLRGDLRAGIMRHKQDRRVALGPNATLYFEDRLTMQYQVQEVLRIEKIFEAREVAEELEAYNPLIPDGHNWKATFMIEYPDEDERREALARLIGIEDKIWVRVSGHDPVYAIADEDLDRETAEKTSSVHFLRFELEPPMVRALRDGAPLAIGSDHGNYRHVIDPVPDSTRRSLLADLD